MRRFILLSALYKISRETNDLPQAQLAPALIARRKKLFASRSRLMARLLTETGPMYLPR